MGEELATEPEDQKVTLQVVVRFGSVLGRRELGTVSAAEVGARSGVCARPVQAGAAMAA